ncbi:hypothetical protein FQN55_004241 [Onygenales sp. PD_40]|nr:hypothetical protein FQN55_004241 [Onygenales sp. PD_40]KAK2783549.1 hypothetical protein FQN53_009172 [Emmonsiellopsis sp. PD_33]KAK2784521.1 hypothetical protein FQN52_008942 [Onygenales sp. PD_12]KAK2799285.1 hypothetical protein FQN51_006962 [Onygenales sp. PD_10]
MSAPAAASQSTAQKQPDATPQEQRHKPTALEEDDEFEDFPVEDWPQEEAEAANTAGGDTTDHLWEESWDDDDNNEDFSKQLKEELKKVEAAKGS